MVHRVGVFSAGIMPFNSFR